MGDVPSLDIRPDGATLQRFIASRARVKGIQGPVGCLSGDSEFLTPGGWRRMDAWRAGDLVAEWDPDSGRIAWRAPRSYLSLPCERMWWFRNGHGLSMMLSDEHRVPLWDWSGRFVVKSAAEIAAKPSRHEVPVSFLAPVSGGLDLADDVLRLAVALHADGCFPKRGHRAIVTVRKERKKARLRSLLGRLGVAWDEHEHSTRPGELTFSFVSPYEGKRFDGAWWSASEAQLRVLLDELPHWDGLHDHAEERFSTAHPGDADFVQFAAHATGRRASIRREDHPDRPGWAPTFTVQITREGSPKGKVGLRGDTTDITREPAPGGRKYCFETASGFFVARHRGRIFVTGNSGKSTASWQSLLLNAVSRQTPANGARGTTAGARHRRTLVLRNTLKQVRDTVLPTMRQVLPAAIFGVATESGRPKLHVQLAGLDWEILFYGMDDPRDVEDLKSFEASDIYASEARYLPREVLVACVERIGRYPPMEAGGCVEPQVIFDTNPPDAGSWLAVISGQSPLPEGLSADERMAWAMPKGWEFFLQPPAVLEVRDAGGVVTGFVENPEAENLRYLQPGYYAEKIAGRTRAEIESELGNKPGSTKVGKSVWPQFRADVHGARGLEAIAGHPLLVGADFGRTPSCPIGQHVFGQWRILREIVTENMGARAFARLLKASMAEWYPGADWACWGDPSGENDEQSDDISPFKVMWAEGVRVLPAPGNNDWVLRRDAVDEVLRRMVDGRPGFLVDRDRCPVLFAGMAGQYAYPRLATAMERYGDRPVKNRFSHVCDGLQYLLLGGGEGRLLLQRSAAARVGERRLARPLRAPDWSPYDLDLGVSW